MLLKSLVNILSIILVLPSLIHGQESNIISNLESGFYKEEIKLVLEIDNSNYKIFYTLNGKDPSNDDLLFESALTLSKPANNENKYANIPVTPLFGPSQLQEFIYKQPTKEIRKCQIVKYQAFDKDIPRSKIYTQIFCLEEPNDKAFTFPVIALTLDSIDLFDYESGIYVPGKTFDSFPWSSWWPPGNYHQKGIAWERKAQIDYFDHTGLLQFSSELGLRMHGYGSAAMPQKSFKLYFRSEYGNSKIYYPFFPENNADYYKRLILRNSGNDFLRTHFRDALLQNVAKKLNLETQNFTPTILMLNGEYWGIYNLRERFDKHYFKSRFGIEEDNLLIVGTCGAEEHGENATYEELISFVSNQDLSILTHYDHVNSILDIENIIEYYLLQIYYGNADWPCNNFKMWKTKDLNSKWRALVYDLDLAFNFDFKSAPSINNLVLATEEGQEFWPNCDCSTTLLRNLLENSEFKNKFITRAWQLLEDEFSPQNILTKIDSFKNIYLPEIQEHLDRWQYPANLEAWNENIDLLKEFAIARPCIFSQQMKDYFSLSDLPGICKDKADSEELQIEVDQINNDLIIRNNSDQFYLLDIFITNTKGQTIYHSTEQRIEKEGKLVIKIDHFNTGFYFLSLVKKQDIKTHKFYFVNF